MTLDLPKAPQRLLHVAPQHVPRADNDDDPPDPPPARALRARAYGPATMLIARAAAAEAMMRAA
jgi:hypothetical protein